MTSFNFEDYQIPTEGHVRAYLASVGKVADEKKIAKNVLEKIKKTNLLNASVEFIDPYLSEEDVEIILGFYSSDACKKYTQVMKSNPNQIFSKVHELILEEAN